MSTIENTTMGGGNFIYDKRITRRYFSKELGTVTKKRLLMRPQELENLSNNSYLPLASDAWNALTQEQKDAWTDASEVCGLTAYNLFIQDKIYRLKNLISGNATPNTNYQYKVLHIQIPESAGHFQLRQVGNVILSLPAQTKVSYESALVSEDPGNEYVKVTTSYKYNDGGGDTLASYIINLSLIHSWGNAFINLTDHTGKLGYWVLDIEGDLVHGDLYLDNLIFQDISGYLNKDPYFSGNKPSFYNIVSPPGLLTENIYYQP